MRLHSRSAGDSVLRLLRNLRSDVAAADAAFAASRLKAGEFYGVLRFCVTGGNVEKLESDVEVTRRFNIA